MRIRTQSSRASNLALLAGLSIVLAGPALASDDARGRPGPTVEVQGKVPAAITKRINSTPEPELVRVPGADRPAPQKIAADDEEAPPPPAKAKAPAPKKPVEARDDDDDDDEDTAPPQKKPASPPAAPQKLAEPPAAPPAPEKQPELPAAPPPVVASPPPAVVPPAPVAVTPPQATPPAPVAVTPPTAAPPAAVPRITEVKPDPRHKNARAPLTLSTGRGTPVSPQGEPQACPEGMECTVCLAGCINRPGEILHMQVKRSIVRQPSPAANPGDDSSTPRPRVRRGGGRAQS